MNPGFLTILARAAKCSRRCCLYRATDLALFRELECLGLDANGRTFCLGLLVGRSDSSSDSGYTAEKGIELLISTLVVGEAGGELAIDLV